MKVLVVYAHPKEDSFNHALLEAFSEGVKEAGHELEVLDLFKDDFDPLLRNPYGKEENEKVFIYQEKIKQADVMALIFPIYWYRGPAILEGFLDQVLSSGFAFKYLPSLWGVIPQVEGLLPVKKVIVMETYGGPSWYYRFLMGRLPWKRIKAVFKFCGVHKFVHMPSYTVRASNKKMLKLYVERAKAFGKKLK
jgi:NAD(P)H dehydrogenase (quinone)